MLLILLGQIGSCFFVCIYTERERERERETYSENFWVNSCQRDRRERERDYRREIRNCKRARLWKKGFYLTDRREREIFYGDFALPNKLIKYLLAKKNKLIKWILL